MSRQILVPFSVLALLAACGGGDDDYPDLLPTQAILAEPTLPDHAGPVAGDDAPVRDPLRGQGADTRARADAIPDAVDQGDLAARAADLRRRAEALRQSSDAATPTTDDCPADAAPGQCPTTDTADDAAPSNQP